MDRSLRQSQASNTWKKKRVMCNDQIVKHSSQKPVSKLFVFLGLLWKGVLKLLVTKLFVEDCDANKKQSTCMSNNTAMDIVLMMSALILAGKVGRGRGWRGDGGEGDVLLCEKNHSSKVTRVCTTAALSSLVLHP